MEHETEAEFVQHESCPKCGSSDNLARYSDGHGYCFGCRHYEKGDRTIDQDEGFTAQTPTTSKGSSKLIDAGNASAWESRAVDLESAQKWGFTRGDLHGQPVRVFTYRDSAGRPVAQKVRFKGKEFKFLGDTKNAGLYGMHLWRGRGKKIVVTEGELDAISVSQAQGHKWPVVSVPNGAQGAKKAIKTNLEWLSQYDEVILMFDMDEPGQAAAEECFELFEPGKCKVASLPRKDPNEMLMEGEVKDIISAIWEAKVKRPDGILAGSDMFDVVSADDVSISTSLPFHGLSEMTHGIRRGELMTFTAGSGVGKSAVVREIAVHMIDIGETVGMMMLEEDTRRTGLGLMGVAASKPLHLDKGLASDDEFQDAFDRTLGSGRVFLYDHFGSTEVDNMLAKVRYLAKGCDCGYIFVDHLSIVISGQEDGDERRMIDRAMTALKTLAVECNVGIILVSHLKRPSGDKGHENGAETSLAQLRGSHSIAQLSDFVIGLERNQQNVSSFQLQGVQYQANAVTTVRVLKNRFTGETGPASWLLFNKETGRLTETREDPSHLFEKGDRPDGIITHDQDDSDF